MMAGGNRISLARFLQRNPMAGQAA